MYTSSVIARAKVALQGSETEQRIAVLLYDDTVQVISSFELNQLASLSYHESMILTSSRNDMVEILIDHVEQITSQPINYSIISVQKSLVVTKHLLLHGAQKVIPIIQQQLGRHIDTLRQYNTVLAAAQQQTTTAWLMRIKGGGVDTAGPVRELAEQVYIMLCNPQQLQFERNTNADPNSLVPIGDRQQIAFVTDDVRHAQLKLRMQQEQSIQMKSNLKKANDGFGGGYMSTNGKNVVGAAHGIEEMIKQKQKEEQRFSDESKNRKTSSSTDHSFSEYVAPTDFYSTSAAPTISSEYQQQQQQQPDLLSLDHYETMPQQQQQAVVVDLLDLGSGVSATSATSTSNNYNSHHNDPFNLSMTAESTSGSQLYPSNLIPQQGSSATGGCTSINPFLHPMSSTATLSLDPYANVASTSMSSAPPPAQQSTAMPFMNHSVDRFAALDVLAGGNNNVGSSMARNNNKSHTTTSNAFSDLVGPFASTSAPVSAATSYNNSNIDNLTSANNYYGFATAPPSMPTVALSSIQVSQPPPSYGNTTDGSENNDDSGFFMGGSTGAGLMPTGHAPASAPPPPPPASFY